MTGEQKRIVVIGAGFAGMWSALSARRAIVYNATEKASPIDVVVIAPSDDLVVRPRLYENGPENMKSSLTELFAATGVRFIKGTVDEINTEGHEVSVLDPQGTRSSVTYDRLVVAAGSRLVRPKIDGLDEHAFSIDSMDEAVKLDNHLKSVVNLPPSPARDTAVVCGGGFTGIEIAAELPARLRAILGPDANVRVVVVDRNQHIGPDLGPGPRPAISEAFKSLGVEMKLGSAVTAVDAEGVTLASGERIETLTAVWTGGVAANALTQQIAGEKDRFGRLHTDRTLRVPSEPHVYATGDTAHAATDDDGNCAMMSCQHANILGRSSGYNAAADLLGVPQVPYEQANYVTCLDLGPWGAVVTKGWEREVELTGAEAKKVKKWINGVLIYPPKADAEEALAAADPVYKIPDLADGAAAGASF
ncbi:hypothetical protein F5144DRAFT_584573 [Chaetomium tenue]|uniref:Uncharacterized protein n=1 Tax=Chaetomium tenue TaxID=1854479 RepID=A0ACB7NZL0_9PEZI|nr:hypothetical protein F5144DRAFT_584573 [Chaetomium globosum]